MKFRHPLLRQLAAVAAVIVSVAITGVLTVVAVSVMRMVWVVVPGLKLKELLTENVTMTGPGGNTPS
jgi:hypothetical protein